MCLRGRGVRVACVRRSRCFSGPPASSRPGRSRRRRQRRRRRAGRQRRRGKTPRSPPRRKRSRGVGRRGKSEKKSVGFALKRGREKGPLGKGPSPASPGQGSLRVRRAASGCARRLGAGRPPCKQGWVLCLAWRWPFAIALLWLPGERGNRPVRRVRVPASAPEGGNGALPTPSPPCKQGRAFSLGTFGACWRSLARVTPCSRGVSQPVSLAPQRAEALLARAQPGGKPEALLSCSAAGLAPHGLAHRACSLFWDVPPLCPCLVGVSERASERAGPSCSPRRDVGSVA
ncbi:serine/arginine repetitive matrix protein 2 [Pseudopipra pipra]|uniref:serine/arginine repetitive matrix protein 2 n=1 Tax=Pseudopipra pipra TaxID=415032 RepID=UPI0031387CEB